MARKSQSKPIRKIFLIVCEGKNTEPFYFNSLKKALNLPRGLITIEISSAEGDASKTVKYTLRILQQAKKLTSYTDIWAVFDCDDSGIHFDTAITEAKKYNIKVAYSNPCFELWFLLHFKNVTDELNQKDAWERLEKCLKFSYNKTLACAKQTCAYLQTNGNELEARKRANNLKGNWDKQETTPAYHKQNPSTLVHHLVTELRALAN